LFDRVFFYLVLPQSRQISLQGGVAGRLSFSVVISLTVSTGGYTEINSGSPPF